MARDLEEIYMKRTRAALIVFIIGSLLPLACDRTAPGETGAPIEPANKTGQQNSPMIPNNPLNSITPIVGTVNYVALGDSTGEGVGARKVVTSRACSRESLLAGLVQN